MMLETWLAALRIFRAIISAKLLMLTRCNLTQFNIVRLSNIALRYTVCSYTATGYGNFSNNANDVYYTNLFLTNNSRSRKLVFNNFKYYSGKNNTFGADKLRR